MLPFAREIRPEFLESEKRSEDLAVASIFEIIKILVTKRDLDKLSANYSPNLAFMVNRMLSSDKAFTKLAYAMSISYDLPIEYVFMFYKYTIPAKKSYSTKYVNNKNRTNNAVLDTLQKFFECNRKKAEEYQKILRPEQIDEIALAVSRMVEYDEQ